MTPTVACICVTQEGREKLLARSIRSFESQTYPYKRLVVIADGDPDYIRRLRFVVGPKHQLIAVQWSGVPLGRLRNIALDSCKDDFATAQWDDDDQYHPERLDRQMSGIITCHASFLGDQLHYLADTNEVYWTDWSHSAKSKDQIIPGTIVAKVSDLRYPSDDRKHEDSHLRDEILARKLPIHLVWGKGWLYLRTYHGKNTWERSHHMAGIRARAHPISVLLKQRAVLTDAVRTYEWDQPTVQIMGRDGWAFEVET